MSHSEQFAFQEYSKDVYILLTQHTSTQPVNTRVHIDFIFTVFALCMLCLALLGIGDSYILLKFEFKHLL